MPNLETFETAISMTRPAGATGYGDLFGITFLIKSDAKPAGLAGRCFVVFHDGAGDSGHETTIESARESWKGYRARGWTVDADPRCSVRRVDPYLRVSYDRA